VGPCDADVDGFVERDGIAIHYEVYGRGQPTIVLLPTWSLFPARHWKFQIPYLSRHLRVLSFDGRGTGRSDRPTTPAAYTDREFASDAVAVMEATGTDQAILASVSCGALWALRLCAEHPDRVLGAVFIGPAVPLAPQLEERSVQRFHQIIDGPTRWQKYNAHYWKVDYADFVDFFVNRIFTESHSTKQVEDAVRWALDTDPEILIAAHLGLDCCMAGSTSQLAAKLRCPALVIHGTGDAVRSYAQGAALAACSGGTLAALEASGHCPHLRDPVKVNLLIKEFVDRICLRNLPSRENGR
jgi:pimeloyl-ACP methyl ester carboxylesterase